MSRNKKIALLLGGSLLLFCVAICAVTLWLVPSLPLGTGEKAKQIGSEIADYQLPRGYAESFGMDTYFEKFVNINPKNLSGVRFTLGLLSPQNATLDNWRARWQKPFLDRHAQGWKPIEIDALKGIMVRGEPVQFLTFQTLDRNQMAAFGIFEGKNGMLTLQIEGKTYEWDKDLIKSFVSSIN